MPKSKREHSKFVKFVNSQNSQSKNSENKKYSIMKTVSLKLQDNIFLETEKMLLKLKKSRNTYINEALEFYNLHQRKQWLAKQFADRKSVV